MNLRKPTWLSPHCVIATPSGLTPWRPWLSGRSWTANQTPTMPLRRPLALILPLIVTLLLIMLVNAPLASAQDASPAKTANTRVSPSRKTLRRQHSRSIWPASKEAPKEAEPAIDPIPTPAAASPLPVPAASSQPGDDRLPFMSANERDSHDPTPSATGLLLRTLGALLLIVGLIVAAAWGMKRFGGGRFGTPQENAPSLAVLNSLSLGERRSLTIVRFGDRTLLLGSTAHAVTLLAEAEPDEFAPHARSVADILNDERPAAFSHELFNATAQLDEQLKARRGDHSNA
jgi:flagellar biosynthetic protein FliO